MVYRMLWSTSSPGQQGTLFQLSQRISRSRIDGDHVKRNVAACREFLEDVSDAHVLAAALKYFGEEYSVVYVYQVKRLLYFDH